MSNKDRRTIKTQLSKCSLFEET